MTLQQLRYVRETVRRGLNLTEAANALHTSQPGISKQIRDLEEELGVDIFVRRGKRFVAITEPGQTIVQMIEKLLTEAEDLRKVGKDFTDGESGHLTIATTHTQARYALPPVVQRFRKRYPAIRLALQEGSPTQVAEMVVRGEADIAIATEALSLNQELITFPGYAWHHCVVVPLAHPLLKAAELTLEQISTYPIITYSTGFSGRTNVDRAFAAKHLKMDIVLSAIDADVIKTYVELGLGVGIIAAMAFDPARDQHIRSIDAAHLFESRTAHVAIRRNAYVRQFAFAFIEMFAPRLTREVIEKARSEAK